MTSTVPVTPWQLTATWLTAALREAGHLMGGEVVSLRPEILDATKAAYGTLVRLTLKYSAAGRLPTTMIAKLPSPNPHAAAIMRASGGYRTEVRFYEQVGASIGMRVPECYGAFLDAATGDFVILLEDLSQHRSTDRASDLRPTDTAAVVRALATSHARWWRSEQLHVRLATVNSRRR